MTYNKETYHAKTSPTDKEHYIRETIIESNTILSKILELLENYVKTDNSRVVKPSTVGGGIQKPKTVETKPRNKKIIKKRN